jgi:hypothetical protein
MHLAERREEFSTTMSVSKLHKQGGPLQEPFLCIIFIEGTKEHYETLTWGGVDVENPYELCR